MFSNASSVIACALFQMFASFSFASANLQRNAFNKPNQAIPNQAIANQTIPNQGITHFSAQQGETTRQVAANTNLKGQPKGALILAQTGVPGNDLLKKESTEKEKTVQLEALQKGEILTFPEWKKEKVREATVRLEETKRQAPPAGQYEHDARVFQSEWNLETASELEVTDYVVVYLSQFVGSKKFEEAAAKLSKTEIAIIMEKYIGAIQKGPKNNPGTNLNKMQSSRGSEKTLKKILPESAPEKAELPRKRTQALGHF